MSDVPCVVAIDADAIAVRIDKALTRRQGMEGATARAPLALRTSLATLGDAVDAARARIGRVDGMVIAFDDPSSLRRSRLDRYRSRRPGPERARSTLMTRLQGVLTGAGVRCVRKPGWEADDVCASVAHQVSRSGGRVWVTSPDADLLGVVRGTEVTVYDPSSGQLYDAPEVEHRVGIPPESFWLYQALVGDRSDDIDGIGGIGPVRARRLCSRWTDLEALGDALETATDEMVGLIGNEPTAALDAQWSHLVENLWLVTKRQDLDVGVDAAGPGFGYRLPCVEQVTSAFTRAGIPAHLARALGRRP